MNKLKDKSIAQIRELICKIVGPGGFMPPDWVTVRRWRENLLEVERLDDDGIRSLLEVHYKADFSAKRKLIPLAEVAKRTGQSIYKVRKIVKDKLFQIGGRFCLEGKDFERLFGGGQGS